MEKTVNIGVVGATGAVGRTMVKVLEERNFPIGELRLFASERSKGKTVVFKGREYTVDTPSREAFQGLDMVFMATGNKVSEEWVPIAVEAGAVVIDNSARFRRDENVPLVVPEVNPGDAYKHEGIIANPNCSTIQMVTALNRLHKSFKVKRVIVTTFQAVSGAGQKGSDELMAQVNDYLADKHTEGKVFPQGIAFNVIPRIGDFLKEGCTEEEDKMAFEAVKILHDESIGISATCVRVPVMNGHSMTLNVETLYPSPPVRVLQVLRKAEGVEAFEDPEFPMPTGLKESDKVFVGRIREDMTAAHAFNMWVVADNLRKGAATNAVQIGELLLNPPE